jgi:hypothetical protein
MIAIAGLWLGGCAGPDIAPWIEPQEKVSQTPSAGYPEATNTPPAMMALLEPSFTPPASITPAARTDSAGVNGHSHDGEEKHSHATSEATPRSTSIDQATKGLLPDLINLPPTDMRLIYDPDSKRMFVRFSNSISNIGPGVLELIGRPTADREHIVVSQRMLDKGGSVVQESLVGEFIFHELHNHWHLDGFALYEVWELTDDGDLLALVASGGKVSYCVSDTQYAGDGDASASPTPRPTYTTCYDELQGLTPGFVDTYYELYPGQYVEITGLPDGVYGLVSTVDPDNTVVEVVEDNNTGVAYFQLQGLRLQELEEPFAEETDPGSGG